MSVDETGGRTGGRCAHIEHTRGTGEESGTMMQTIGASSYRGMRVRMRGWMRTEEVTDAAAFFMRVDGFKDTPLAFDNMQDRGVSGTQDWQQHEIVLDVAENAASINFGFRLGGRGKLWVDTIEFDVVADVPTTDLRVPVEPWPHKPFPENYPHTAPANLDFAE